MLIAKIYPSRDEYEAHQEKVLANLSKSHSQSALLNSIEEGIKIQSQNRGTRIRKNAPDSGPVSSSGGGGDAGANNSSLATTPNVSAPSTPTPSEASSSAPSAKKRAKLSSNLSENESTGSGAEGPSSDMMDKGDNGGPSGLGPSYNEIELVFKPHPVEMGSDHELIKALKENSIRYIKTTSHATGKPIPLQSCFFFRVTTETVSSSFLTVDHLSKYLAMRLTLDLESEMPDSLTNFCIYISPSPGQFNVLTGMQTLDDVNEKFWKVNQPLEMFYSWKK